MIAKITKMVYYFRALRALGLTEELIVRIVNYESANSLYYIHFYSPAFSGNTRTISLSTQKK